MSKSLLLMICLLTGLLVLSCSKAENTNKNTNTNTAAPAPASSVVTNKNTNSTAGATAEKIGVEECDAYITAYENCVTSKVPEAQRAQYQNSLSQLRSSWKKLADNPATKSTLASVCKTAHENAKVSMKSFNCTF